MSETHFSDKRQGSDEGQGSDQGQERTGIPGLLLTEDDAFFLLRLLEHLDTEEERHRLVEIAEKLAKVLPRKADFDHEQGHQL